MGTTQLEDEVKLIDKIDVVLRGEQGSGKQSEKYLQYIGQRRQDC